MMSIFALEFCIVNIRHRYDCAFIFLSELATFVVKLETFVTPVLVNCFVSSLPPVINAVYSFVQSVAVVANHFDTRLAFALTEVRLILRYYFRG